MCAEEFLHFVVASHEMITGAQGRSGKIPQQRDPQGDMSGAKEST